MSYSGWGIIGAKISDLYSSRQMVKESQAMCGLWESKENKPWLKKAAPTSSPYDKADSVQLVFKRKILASNAFLIIKFDP